MPKCKQWWVSKWHFLKRQLLNWDLLFEIEQSYSQQIHPPFHTMYWIGFYVGISRDTKFNAKSTISDFGSLLMHCPFTSPKMFCAGPNFLSQSKNLTAFSASSKTFVPAQKPILLNANHLFVWHKMLVTATIRKWIFGQAQKIWTSPKHFGTCKRTRHKSFRRP